MRSGLIKLIGLWPEYLSSQILCKLRYFINLRKLKNRADHETRGSLLRRDLIKALKLAEAIVSNANSVVSRVDLGTQGEALQDPENGARLWIPRS